MCAEKDTVTFTALEAVKQARSALREAFPDAAVKATIERKNNHATIFIQWKGIICLEDIEQMLKSFVGFIDIGAGLRLPLWHKKDKGIFYHYQVDCIKYKTDTWREITVTQEDKSTNWRFWRLSAEEFDTNLKPYLNRWKEENKNVLYSIIVDNKVQSTVANSSGVTRQAINEIVKRAFKIYSEANAKPKNPSTENK